MCPEHDRTVLWLYGESADFDEQALHVAGCAHCSAVLAEHEGVATALGPALAAVGGGRAPVPRRRTAFAAVAAAPILLAAAALVAVLSWPPPTAPDARSVALDTDPQPVAGPGADPLESEIDALDRELAALELELL